MVERLRATVFGEDAQTYEAARPSYPAAVIDLITGHAPADAVDVGCGTGKAARLVAARGVRVAGVEPDERMATLARSHGIAVEVTPLERWSPTSCDLMYAAQSWHWVDFTVGASVAAAAVRLGGRWAAFWNREDDPPLQRRIDAVYDRLAPQLRDGGPAADRDEMERTIAEAFAATGAFDPVEAHNLGWVETVSGATYVQRLGTYSGHRLLSREVADTVHQALADELGTTDDPFPLAYTTRVLIARRR
jgi:SAM-dependent methyltransferase